MGVAIHKNAKITFLDDVNHQPASLRWKTWRILQSGENLYRHSPEKNINENRKKKFEGTHKSHEFASRERLLLYKRPDYETTVRIGRHLRTTIVISFLCISNMQGVVVRRHARVQSAARSVNALLNVRNRGKWSDFRIIVIDYVNRIVPHATLSWRPWKSAENESAGGFGGGFDCRQLDYDWGWRWVVFVLFSIKSSHILWQFGESKCV